MSTKFILSSLIFLCLVDNCLSVCCYVGNGGSVRNDIRFAILDAFERENIEIPVLQRQVRILEGQPQRQWPADDDDKLDAELAEKVRRREEEQRKLEAGKRRRRKPTPSDDEANVA